MSLILSLLAILGASAGVGAVGSAISIWLEDGVTEDAIEDQLEEDDALYAEIKKISPNSLSMEEIDRMGDKIGDKELRSNKIDNSLYVGQRIYNRNR